MAHGALRALVTVSVLLVALSLAAPAAAEPPEKEVTATPREPASWGGATGTGANINYDSGTGEPCGDRVDDMCETVLLHVDVPSDFWEGRTDGLQVRLGDYSPNPTSDFDLYIYRRNADGTRGELVASSADVPGEPEAATIKQARGNYIVQVVYFAVTASRYSARTSFVFQPSAPPDVDDPPGLQEALASDPSKGFRSHSEPHIAQSPLNPNLLIAASKMYNTDRDSLKEYEFKVGAAAQQERHTRRGDTRLQAPRLTCRPTLHAVRAVDLDLAFWAVEEIHHYHDILTGCLPLRGPDRHPATQAVASPDGGPTSQSRRRLVRLAFRVMRRPYHYARDAQPPTP